jgi:hypothetical protein
MTRNARLGLGAAAVLLAMQFVQPDRSNPPEVPGASFEEVANPPREVAAVLDRACRDCHSHRTTWPWYSRVSPVSWMLADHVQEGRAHLNLSEWNRLGPEASGLRLTAMCNEMKRGAMPLWSYRLVHREARVLDAEVAAVCGFAERVRATSSAPGMD